MKSLREADRMSKDYKNDGPSFTTYSMQILNAD